MKSYLLPLRGKIVGDPEPFGEEGDPYTVPCTQLPPTCRIPRPDVATLRYGYDGLRRFTTE